MTFIYIYIHIVYMYISIWERPINCLDETHLKKMFIAEEKKLGPQAPEIWINTEMQSLGRKGHEIVIFRNFGVDPRGHWWPFADNPWFCVCKVIYITFAVCWGPLAEEKKLESWPHNWPMQQQLFFGYLTQTVFFVLFPNGIWSWSQNTVFVDICGGSSINRTFPHMYQHI